MNTQQIQLKISLSDQLNDLLQSKASRLGIPVTQFVKHLIIKEVETEEYPTFKMSERTEKRAKEAMEQINNAVSVNDVTKFFEEL
ncbi:MAG TPA: hypothetical protein VM077_03480 [Candidatus Limnocylindrales bacterium]|nr:hypothetical protein [Candidatus Limnocylindrales bacterium]